MDRIYEDAKDKNVAAVIIMLKVLTEKRGKMSMAQTSLKRANFRMRFINVL